MFTEKECSISWIIHGTTRCWKKSCMGHGSQEGEIRKGEGRGWESHKVQWRPCDDVVVTDPTWSQGRWAKDLGAWSCSSGRSRIRKWKKYFLSYSLLCFSLNAHSVLCRQTFLAPHEEPLSPPPLCTLSLFSNSSFMGEGWPSLVRLSTIDLIE